jgi:hypothetical protein
MISERQFVDYHVLYGQNEIINELVKASIIEDEAVYNPDVLEWWLITPQLAKWLKAENEVILEVFDNYWWGRTVSGQAIYIDGVITNIAKRLN